MATSSDGTAEFEGDYPTVFAAACSAATAEKMRVTYADDRTGLITVSAEMSAFSWGENAEIRVWQVRPGVQGVGVRSALKFGLVDWGRNKKNVERLFARIQQVLTESPPPTPAGWHRDPTGRHESRYWDGAAWTDHVADAGVSGRDRI